MNHMQCIDCNFRYQLQLNQEEGSERPVQQSECRRRGPVTSLLWLSYSEGKNNFSSFAFMKSCCFFTLYFISVYDILLSYTTTLTNRNSKSSFRK